MHRFLIGSILLIACGTATATPANAGDGPIVVTVRFAALAGKRADALAAIRVVQSATRREPGNVQLDLHQEEGKPDSFLFYERWTSRRAWQRHVDKPYLRRFNQRATALFERPPLLQIFSLVAPIASGGR